MAKRIFKITLPCTIYNGGAAMDHPMPAELVGIPIKMIAHEYSTARADVISRNDGKAYVIGVVANDTDAAHFVASPNAEELTQEMALTQGTLMRPETTSITDTAMVMSICEKIVASQSLSVEELDAINPSKSTKGIVRNKAFSAFLTEGLNG